MPSSLDLLASIHQLFPSLRILGNTALFQQTLVAEDHERLRNVRNAHGLTIEQGTSQRDHAGNDDIFVCLAVGGVVGLINVRRDACLATCSFDTENKYEVTAILCEKQTLYFENKNGIITFNFEISGLTGPTRTLYVHSILRDPGLTLRIEQNHIGRRAGKYREGDYPASEILAANHYMFAMREMLYALDLPQYLNRNRLGYLLILGFETNNEIHTDYPPHWHLIYRWPNHAGSPAPHIYLAPDGKMTENACYVDCAHGTHRDYSAGEWCPFVDPYGHDVCAIRINADGGMSITKPMSSIYTMSAYTPDVGVTIYKDDTLIGTIRTENDTDQGIFNVTWNSTGNLNFHGSYSETIEYNPLTGAILKIKR